MIDWFSNVKKKYEKKQLMITVNEIRRSSFGSVTLCDSRAALLAIVSNNNPKIQDILDCRYHLENLPSLEKL
ncbi:hypothetical protein CEXT_282571 [Caerostris extrusa]|uniref:Uncharacterized protein n=1 Tax=Caerostris extrusa TaxID=172846 RepID=A0AAV4UKZ2_CAEEX|nr:hypothetical protein CEXT_282571 [Caerostris extrusa]